MNMTKPISANNPKYIIISCISLILSYYILLLTSDSIDDLIQMSTEYRKNILRAPSSNNTYTSVTWHNWLLDYSAIVPLGFQLLFLAHIYIAIFFQSKRQVYSMGVKKWSRSVLVSCGAGAFIYLTPFFSLSIGRFITKLRYSYGFLHFFRDEQLLSFKLSRSGLKMNSSALLLMAAGSSLFIKTIFVSFKNEAIYLVDSAIVVLIFLILLDAYKRNKVSGTTFSLFEKVFIVGLCFAPALFIQKSSDLVYVSIYVFSYHIVIWYIYFLQDKISKNLSYLSLFILVNGAFFLIAENLVQSGTLHILSGSQNLWASSYYFPQIDSSNFFYAFIFDARFYHFWAIFHVTQSWFK